MQPTVYQKPELRDANDNIIQQGAFGKNTALANATNDGWIDYVANDLEFLYDLAKDEVVPVPSLPASGQTNKTYLLTTTGVSYRWSGTQWVAVSSSEAVGRAESAANLAEQWATKTDGTVDGTEYSAKYYAGLAEASADDAQDVADDMATHLVQIDKNTGGVAKNSKRISNIEKLLQGNLYDYDTDDDVAYTKTVPSGALPYAGVEQIGGKTLVMNQLVKNQDVSNTGDGITTAYDSTTHLISITNDSRTTNFSTGSTQFVLTDVAPIIGHKYIVRVSPHSNESVDGIAVIFSYNSNIRQTYQANTIATFSSENSANGMRLRVTSAYDFVDAHPIGNVAKYYINVVDLTLAFGAGNEPTTVAEFESMFPASYYPYNAGTLLSAGVTSVVSTDSNDDALQTLSIPAEVQALTGYGWSAGSVSNYIDFERKVFVKCVDRIVLDGTQNIVLANWRPQTNSVGWMYAYSLTNHKPPATQYTTPNIVADKVEVVSYNGIYNNDKNCISAINGTNYGLCLRIANTSLTDSTAINAYLSANPITVYYELATPVETDISAYLTDDNLIEVGAGGTLTFPNSNGDDYHIPVPSDVTYMIDLQEAISNG